MKKEEITIFAPASISNVGSGFDVLGFALEEIGDIIHLKKRTDEKLVIQSIIGAELTSDPKINLVGVVISAMLKELKISMGLDINITKGVMPGSGLGSSGPSSSGAAFALNELLGCPFNKLELTKFAMMGEKFVSSNSHADNVAPSIYGGFILVRSYSPLDIVTIPSQYPLYVFIIHPQIEIKTADARKVLPENISLKQATIQWGNLAGLVLGISQGKMDLIEKSMEDVIVEPVRSKLIPHYDMAKKQAIKLGAIGYTISGSGPAMFGFARNMTDAEGIANSIKSLYINNDIQVRTYTSLAGAEGARVI